MDLEIAKLIAKTGGVAGGAFLIVHAIVDRFFQEPVYQFLGDEKFFLVLLGLIFGVVAITYIAFRHRDVRNASKRGNQVSYRNSTHRGDNNF